MGLTKINSDRFLTDHFTKYHLKATTASINNEKQMRSTTLITAVAVPEIMHVGAGFSTRRLGFDPEWLQLTFVVDEVRVLKFSPANYHSIISKFLRMMRAIAQIKQHIIKHLVLS